MFEGEFISIVIAGLVCGFVDCALGMGFGVTAASVLVSFGIAPVAASASVHTAEAVVDTFSAGAHLRLGNVRRNLVLPLLLAGGVGAFLGAVSLTFLAVRLAKTFFAVVLVCMGALILIKFLIVTRKSQKFSSSEVEYSKKRVALMGFIAGFIDASGGGGWGPILTPAFVATGSNPGKAVGTVEFTEPIISVVTFLTFGYLIGFESFLWSIVVPMLIGGIILTPVAAYVCSKAPRRLLGIFIGLWVTALNIRTLILSIL